ncbi:hypothetical protein BJ138DRAFT_979434, partial [Hygrophoropsis aurantiaca]
IYAPNDTQENEEFWVELEDKLKQTPRPDVVLGDFNLVEDGLDRLPPHKDRERSVEALGNLKAYLGIQDGWRDENPDELAYTYTQSAAQGGRQSRIDRIYVRSNMLPFCKEWKIEPPGIPTDHQLISARISDNRLPYVGKGRWTLPLFVLKQKELSEEIIDLVAEMQFKMNDIKDKRTQLMNPQIIFKQFKEKAIKACRNAAKKSIPKIQLTIDRLSKQIKENMNDISIPEEERRLTG